VKLSADYQAALVSTNKSNSPLSTVQFRLSRPCGNQKDSYVNRPVNINNMYDSPNQCSFADFDGKAEHSLFFDTVFGDFELNVYS
jgi:hypothetical protein